MTATALYESMKSEFDFNPVLDTAIREYSYINRDKVHVLLDAFLQWFSLVPQVEEGQALQMNQFIDPIWHSFILNTRLYREFCDKFAGHYVDHDPLDLTDQLAPKDKYTSYTLSLLRENFGARLNPVFSSLEGKATCCYWSGVTRCRRQ